MCHTDNEMRKTTNDGGNRTSKQEKIRMLGEKETYKYLGILEVDIIKHAKMKENFF